MNHTLPPDRHDDYEDDDEPDLSVGVAAAPRRTLWAIGAGVTVVVFVAVVVMSTRSASVPVGASAPTSGMSGMAMGAHPAMTLRDLSNRTVRLPGAHVSVVVFAEARACASCVSAVRAARDAIRQATARVQLVVVFVDSATTREDAEAFARSVGRSPARYVIDDRNGGVASMLGASSLGDVVVYDAGGRVVAHPDASAGAIGAALRRADR